MIPIPATLECLVPLLAVVPLQLLAYHIAVAPAVAACATRIPAIWRNR